MKKRIQSARLRGEYKHKRKEPFCRNAEGLLFVETIEH